MLKLRLIAITAATLLMGLSAVLAYRETPAYAKVGAGRINGAMRAARHARAVRWLHRRVNYLEGSTKYMQRVMGITQTRAPRRMLASHGIPHLQTTRRFWKHNHARTLAQYRNVPHKQDWLCIHHYEGSWQDPNPPYWGGLQMDWSFMDAYGGWLLRSKGTADHWTPLEQMWVAERAYRTRGFYPWPNTARFCGLL